jgi:hypothetical protein
MEMELKIEDYKRQLQQQHANLAARLESDINQLLGEQSISPADTQDSTSTAMNPTNGNEQQQQQQPNEEIDPFKMDETILNNHPIENVVDMSDSDDNNDESNELTDVNNSAAVMLMSTSLPIRIPMTTAAGTSANQSRHGDNESEQFTPPHILSAQTFRQTSSLSVFGDLPPPSSSVRISIALKDSNR